MRPSWPARRARARNRCRAGGRRRSKSRSGSRPATAAIARGYPPAAMADTLKIIVLEGDETGQELLEQAVRVLDPEVLGVELELGELRPLAGEAAGDGQRDRPRGGARDARRRLRAEGGDRHPRGQGRRRLAEPDPARGGRRQGDRPHRPPDSRRGRAGVGRLSPDLRGPDGRRRRLRRQAVARGRGRRGARVPDREGVALDLPGGRRVRVHDRRADGREGLRRAEVDGLAGLRGDAQGGDWTRPRSATRASSTSRC